jgi:hypothetical protein
MVGPVRIEQFELPISFDDKDAHFPSLGGRMCLAGINAMRHDKNYHGEIDHSTGNPNRRMRLKSYIRHCYLKKLTAIL